MEPRFLTGTGPGVDTSSMTTVRTPTGERIRLDQRAVAELGTTLRGELVGPADRGYETHRRVWNGSIDRHPALIVRCAGVADVIDAVRFARRVGLPVAVRSGGHSFPGLSVCDDGLVIDLSLMKGVRVDLASRTVRAQAGVRLGELDRETQAFGLAVPAGIVTHTGLAGLTLGGGIGWLMRKYGLTIDQLRSVDLVTADGELVKASAQENSDLFWGVRGPGEPRHRHRVRVPAQPRRSRGPRRTGHLADGAVGGGVALLPRLDHRRAGRAHHDRRAPQGAPLPVLPPGCTADPSSRLSAATPDRWRRASGSSSRSRPSAAADRPVRRTPFVKHQAMFDASFPEGWWYYFRSCDVATLTDEVIDITAEHAQRIRSPLTAFPIFHLGGAVGRVSDDETAFHGRTAGHTFNINATTATRDGFEEEREWSRSFWSALQPYHTGVYVNFLMDEGEQRIRDAYGTDKYDRLRALKRKYDPDNFFRLNQNIPPA